MNDYTIVFEIFKKKFRVKIKANSQKEAYDLISMKIFNNITFLSCDKKNNEDKLFDFLNGFGK